jgi:hypothetical protein
MQIHQVAVIVSVLVLLIGQWVEVGAVFSFLPVCTWLQMAGALNLRKRRHAPINIHIIL